MSLAERNKAVVQRIYVEGFNRGSYTILSDLVAAHYVDHEAPPGFAPGPMGMAELMHMYRDIYPDLEFTLEDMIATEDTVVTRISMSGTQAKEFLGAPPDGARIVNRGIDIFRLSEGKVTDHWGAMNMVDAARIFGRAAAAANNAA